MPQDTISTGNHTAHLNAAFGPNTPCVPATRLRAQRADARQRREGPRQPRRQRDDLRATNTCDNCHGTGTANAKNPTNWSTKPTSSPACSATTAARTAHATAPGSWPRKRTRTGRRPVTGGRRSTPPPGTCQAGPGYLCTVCHDETAPHINGTLGDHGPLPSVADDGIDYTSDVSEVCLDCHKVGQSRHPPEREPPQPGRRGRGDRALRRADRELQHPGSRRPWPSRPTATGGLRGQPRLPVRVLPQPARDDEARHDAAQS